MIRDLEDDLYKLIKKTEVELPEDTILALKRAFERESNQLAKIQLETILKNIELAKRLNRPICQDTGTPTFFVEVGYDFPYYKDIKTAILKSVKRATKEIPLRSNTVDPFTGKNTNTNIGKEVPWIEWYLTEGDYCRIKFLPKGGGSENCSALKMFNPTDDIEKIKRFILEHIIECGGKPCPPNIIGIGIGGGADIALKLAKRALLKPIGEKNENGEITELENKIKDMLNKTGIGPMGLGGETTVLDVHIEYASRHPASFPVGIAVQCWADRRRSIIINSNGDIKWE